MTRIEVVPGATASSRFRRRVVALCNRAYGEELEELFATMAPVAHVVARRGASLVSHALWVDRWLQVGDADPVRTAYVELVATLPEDRGRGLATAVLERLASARRSR